MQRNEVLGTIKVLAMDHDGVLSSLYIYQGIVMPRENAALYEASKRDFTEVVEFARYSHRDGRGLDELTEVGVTKVVITSQRSGYPLSRGWKLGVEVVQARDKLAGLKTWLTEHPEFTLADVCFVGDDTNDIPVFREVGLAVCVGDGHPFAKAAAHFVCKAAGGDGAIREICDLIYEAKGGKR